MAHKKFNVDPFGWALAIVGVLALLAALSWASDHFAKSPQAAVVTVLVVLFAVSHVLPLKRK